MTRPARWLIPILILICFAVAMAVIWTRTAESEHEVAFSAPTQVTATPTLAPTPEPRATPSATTAQSTPTQVANSTVRAPSPAASATIAKTTAARTPAPNDRVFVGAGDIASCVSNGDEATALLLDNISGTVFTLGDNVYPNGTSSDFTNCYAPSWGRFKTRTRPVPGNHDYGTGSASAYLKYFGAAAGDASKSYYSYDLGAWHLIALNSEIVASLGSPQEKWLRADLAANPKTCTLAYWHKPRFSSGPHGSDVTFRALWQALYDYGAEVVLNGHDHDYERFAPQNPDGEPDSAKGIREFVVGTGGASAYPFLSVRPNSEAQIENVFGVLKLTLHATSYDWQFMPVAGETETDMGSAACH